MLQKDIAIQFALEFSKTSNKVDSFDPETGLILLKVPVAPKEVCESVRQATLWFLNQDHVKQAFLSEVRKYNPSFSDTMFDVTVRIAKPAEDFVGWSTVDASIRDEDTVGSLSIVLCSFTVIDSYSVIEGLQQVVHPSIVPSLFLLDDDS